MLDGLAESNHKLRHIFFKYQLSNALLSLRSKLRFKQHESVVSLRPWIKDSSCLHWILLNHYKVSDGLCLDTFSNPSLSGRNLLGKFMVFQKFQDSPFTGDFPFVQTKRAYWNSSLINVDVSECKGRESY